MFNLLTKRAHVASTTAQLRLVRENQRFFSIFGIFKKKEEVKKEEPAVETPKQEEKAQQVEPTRYHKETVQKVQEGVEQDIKTKIRDMDRTGGDNLYGKYKRVRKTLKERNTQLDQHLHPDLLKNPRVTISKYENNQFKRGLDNEDKPFPVSPKIGPYLVEKPVFGAKNYFYCTCGLSSNQHKGSAFKPIKFSLDEKSERLHLCGCKLTTQAPFCDGQTCKKLISGDSFDAAESLYAQSKEEPLK